MSSTSHGNGHGHASKKRRPTSDAETAVHRTGKPGRPRKVHVLTAAATAHAPAHAGPPSKAAAHKPVRRRGGAAAAELDRLVLEKRRQLQADTADDPAVDLARRLTEVERQLADCKGVEHILKAKLLQQQRDDLLKTRDTLSRPRGSRDQEMFDYMARLERLEKSDADQFGGRRAATGATPTTTAAGAGGGSGSKVIPLYSRLCPSKPTQKNLLDHMSARDVEKWQTLRAHKKRFAIVYARDHPKARENFIDTCQECRVDLVVDRELAIAVCPECGGTRQFASHIFENKEMEKDDSGHRQQTLNHMQKFSAQFERGQAGATPEVLEALATAYSRVHLHDPSKVQACRTSTLLKSLPEVPKASRRLPDRLTKELKGEGIPEFTNDQIQQLLRQRHRLRVPDDMAAEALAMDAASSVSEDAATVNKKSRKSFNNQIFMRQLGRSSHMEPARIFPNPKTTRIHIERTRALEKECMNLGVVTATHVSSSMPPVPPPSSTTTTTPWALYPAS